MFVFAFLGALISEVGAWLTVYRKDHYKCLKSEIEHIARKIEQQKLSGKISKGKADEEQLKVKSQQVSWERAKAGLASCILYFIFVPVMYRRFDGIVVAKLPFKTILFLKSLSHQSLPGDDVSDCSVMFLYVLAIGFFRSCLPKILGTAAPPGIIAQSSPFGNFSERRGKK